MPSLQPSLKTIRIASPCLADWNAMAGDDRRRFCKLCERNVYNLSAMTEREADRLLSTTDGQICARLYRRADGTVLTEDCPAGWIATKRRVSRVAGVMLSTALGMCGNAFAQSPGAPLADGKKTITSAEQATMRGVSGTVMDSTGAAIVNANLKLIKITKHTEFRGATDQKGTFLFTDLQTGVYTLTAESPGFQAFKKDNIALVGNRRVDLNIRLEVGIMGEIVETGAKGSVVETRKSLLPRFLHLGK